jgi:hypothetical protein
MIDKPKDYATLLSGKASKIGGIRDSESFLAAHLEVIYSSGKSNPWVSGAAFGGRWLGGPLAVTGAALSLYEISSAPKEQQAAMAGKEIARAAFSAAGSSLGGALGAFLGVPVAVTLGIFLAPEVAVLLGFGAGCLAGASLMKELVDNVIEAVEKPGGSYEGALEEWLRNISQVRPPEA